MTKMNTHSVLFSLFCIFLFSLGAMSQPSHNQTDCNPKPNTYQSNRNIVLSTLRNRSLGSYYGYATAGLSPNIAYGMFLCLGNISRISCSKCVQPSTIPNPETCHFQDRAFAYSDDCIVWYSDVSSFSSIEDEPVLSSHSLIDPLDSPFYFNQTLPGKIGELIPRASSSSPVPYFVEDQVHVTQLEGSYDLQAVVQCTPDLDSHNCTTCLTRAVRNIDKCCSQARWVRIYFAKCVVGYNISALQPNASSLGKGIEIFGRTLIAIMTALVLTLIGL